MVQNEFVKKGGEGYFYLLQKIFVDLDRTDFFTSAGKQIPQLIDQIDKNLVWSNEYVPELDEDVVSVLAGMLL